MRIDGKLRLFSRGSSKQPVAEYGHEIRRFDLPGEGRIEYAQWLHPSEAPKSISQEMIDTLRVYIRPGDMVVDIGAHTGDTSLPMALAAGPEGCCLALEPNPYVFRVLEANASLNQDRACIVPLNYAATDTDGTFTFHYSDAAFCNGGFLSTIKKKRHGNRFALEVQGRNLEEVLRRDYADRLDRLSYVKIDTEGYDWQVIQSLMGVLREYRPVVRTEVLNKLTLEEREKLFGLLRDAGYDCYKYDEDSYSRGDAVAESDLMRWKQFDILALPG